MFEVWRAVQLQRIVPGRRAVGEKVWVWTHVRACAGGGTIETQSLPFPSSYCVSTGQRAFYTCAHLSPRLILSMKLTD